MTECFGEEPEREIKPSQTDATRNSPASFPSPSSPAIPYAQQQNAMTGRVLRTILTLIMLVIGVLAGLTVKGNGHAAAPEVRAAHGREPAPTTMATWECGDSSAPVLNSADIVSYYTLQEGEAAVYGSKDHEVVYNGYLFRFALAGNKALFEVKEIFVMFRNTRTKCVVSRRLAG